MGNHFKARPIRRVRNIWLAVAAFVLVAALALGGWVMSLQHRTYDVIAVLGQSNAAGAGKGAEPFGKDAWDSSVYQIGAFGPTSGVVLPGGDPLMHPDPDFRAIGFGTTFAKAYAADTGRDVLLVPVAAKSTGFTEGRGYSWDTDYAGDGTSLYRLAQQQIRAALNTNEGSRLAGVLWLQGESDTSHLSGDEYEANLTDLIEGLRAEFGDVPFLAGQMSPDWIAENPETRGPINGVHSSLPATLPHAAFVPGPSGLTNTGDSIHYSAEGQRELGRRFWQAYKDLR